MWTAGSAQRPPGPGEWIPSSLVRVRADTSDDHLPHHHALHAPAWKRHLWMFSKPPRLYVAKIGPQFSRLQVAEFYFLERNLSPKVKAMKENI